MTPDCKASTLEPLDVTFNAIDIAFLVIFLFEIIAKIFGLGARLGRTRMRMRWQVLYAVMRSKHGPRWGAGGGGGRVGGSRGRRGGGMAIARARAQGEGRTVKGARGEEGQHE